MRKCGHHEIGWTQECVEPETSNGQAVEYRAYRLYLCPNVHGSTNAIIDADVRRQIRDISLVADRLGDCLRR